MSQRNKKATEGLKWPARLGGSTEKASQADPVERSGRDNGLEHDSKANTSQSEDPARSYHMSEEEIETLLKLHEQGLNQVEIAEAIGRNVSNVCRTLQKYRPTVNLAKAKIANTAARAVETAENLLKAESEKVRLDAAALFLRANNLAGDSKAAQVGIAISLGSVGGSPLPTVQVLSSETVS